MGIYTLARSALWSLSGYPADNCRRLLGLSQNWTREQLEDYRNQKLRQLIAHCYNNVPYYRRIMDRSGIRPKDILSAEDLPLLPILTKETIRAHAKELQATNIAEMKTTWSKTGGTTGEPIRVCKNIECKAMETICYERGLRWGGLSADARRVRLFGGSLGLEAERLTARAGRMLRGDLFLPAFELNSENARSYILQIKRSRGRFLLGYASAIYRLAILSATVKERVAFEAVFPTAELLLPEWEEAIRRLFSCDVLPYYGCGEVNSLGYFTPGSEAYLIPEEHALIEVMQNGSTALYGEGQFLMTDLDNYAMPIIRYVNGDAGKLAASEGRFPYTRIERLDGRYNSFLLTDTGELISGVIGTHVFRNTSSVRAYRIIQEEPLRIVIKVVPQNGLSEDDQRLIVLLFQKHLGSRMQISLEKVSDLPVPPSGKSVFVVNRCLERSSESVHSVS